VFHGAVDEALPMLDQMEGLSGRSEVYAKWLRGVALGACGRYGDALEVVDQIAAGTPEYSMARSLRGSLLRQLGCHDLALLADREAMAGAATPGAAIEAMTGLAADAVGLQDALTSTTTLAQARSLLDRVTADTHSAPTWWRHQVRLAWVECEVALLQSRYEDAVTHAALALDEAEAATAPRHVAKSLLFLAVADIEAGRREVAVPNLRRSIMLSGSMGFLAVAWPAHAVLAALLKESDPEIAHAHFVEASAITDTLRAGLRGQLATRWDARPDIVALHREAS
jgi:tetratricopeptide (TPR) repeat protein